MIDLPQCNLKTCRKCFEENCTDRVEYNRCEFAHYNDLVEQRRLIVAPPCKVGDILNSFSGEKMLELEVMSIKYEVEAENYGVFIRERIVVACEGIMTELDWSDIGNTVFVTKSEAERALAERQKNGNNSKSRKQRW